MLIIALSRHQVVPSESKTDVYDSQPDVSALGYESSAQTLVANRLCGYPLGVSDAISLLSITVALQDCI